MSEGVENYRRFAMKKHVVTVLVIGLTLWIGYLVINTYAEFLDSLSKMGIR